MADQNPLPLVSIGISTYNRANDYLEAALRSAVEQTYPNIEIIVSDNCSTDHTEAVVKSFLSPRIKYFRQEKNIGANNNFNFCLEMAHGNYFLLLHDDDLIDPDFIEICMKALGDAQVGIIRTGTRIIDEQGKTINKVLNRVGGYSTADFFLGWFSGKTAFYFCSTLFNTCYLKKLGGFKSKTNLFQDVVALVQLAAQHGRVDVSDIKASFRRHGNNAGASAPNIAHKWSEDSLYLLDVMCSLVPEKAEIIRKEGLPYLCRKCYRYISAMPYQLNRYRVYAEIYRKFEYCCSPLNYFFYRQVQRLKRLARGKVRIS
jgi:glycosyltransferase involved in cell wall biosynthesis